MSEETKEFLDNLDGSHSPAQVEDMAYGKLPDGTYQVRLDQIFVSKSKNTERVQCVMAFEILAGELAYRTIYKYSGMETAQNLDFLTRDLRTLGAPVNFKWSEIENSFTSFLDTLLEIQLKSKGEFQNVYILKKLDQNKVLKADQKPQEDDVPF